MGKKLRIIGITGLFGSGKTTATKFFESRGFVRVELSSFLEEEATRKGIKSTSRKVLQDLGNEWRKQYGTGILAKKAIAHLKKANTLSGVVGGIRNIGEIDQFSKEEFILIAIIADRKLRFQRLQQLKRREPLSWELFDKLDRRDLGIGEGIEGLHVAECIALADIFIENNNAEAEFIRKLEHVFSKLE